MEKNPRVTKTLRRYGVRPIYSRAGRVLADSLRGIPAHVQAHLPSTSNLLMLAVEAERLFRGLRPDLPVEPYQQDLFAALLASATMDNLGASAQQYRAYLLSFPIQLAVEQKSADPYRSLLISCLSRNSASLPLDAATILARSIAFRDPNWSAPILDLVRLYSVRKRADIIGFLSGMIAPGQWEFFAMVFDTLQQNLPDSVREDLVSYFAWRGVHFGERKIGDALDWTRAVLGDPNVQVESRWYVWNNTVMVDPADVLPTLEIKESNPFHMDGTSFGASFFSTFDFSKIYSVQDLVDMVLYRSDAHLEQQALDALVKITNNRELSQEERLAVLPMLQSRFGPKFACQITSPSTYYTNTMAMVGYQPQTYRMLLDATIIEVLSTHFHQQIPLPFFEHEVQMTQTIPSTDIWRVPYHLLVEQRKNYSSFFTK